MTRPERLADHLEPELSPARLARNRAAVEEKLARRKVVWPWALLGLSAALAATLVVVLRPPAPSPSAPAIWAVTEGAHVSAGDRRTEIALDDGSRVVLEPRAAISGLTRSPVEVSLALERGTALFRVARDPARSFRVRSGDVEVRVIGTVFSVTREAGRVSVEVEEGRVEVHAEAVHVLGAGERWSGDETVPAELAPTPVEPLHEPTGTEAPSPEAEARPSRPRETPSEPAIDAAQALFEAARAARREGRPDRAAALFAELVEQHPGDPRAGLAAFELGRIRHDVMHDPRAAIEALERALDLSPRGGFRPDALARLVVLYARVGEIGRCREAQSRYLADYPDGVHLDEVRAGCE